MHLNLSQPTRTSHYLVKSVYLHPFLKMVVWVIISLDIAVAVKPNKEPELYFDCIVQCSAVLRKIFVLYLWMFLNCTFL